MSILVKLYGKLSERGKENVGEKGFPATLDIEIRDSTTIVDILQRLKIEEKEISHIFLNGVYTGPGTQIKVGDRIGIFPSNMALMFAEIPDLNSIHITVKTFKMNGEPEFHIKIPRGSILNSIIRKLNLSNQLPNYKILVNGKHSEDYHSVIMANDVIEILPIYVEKC